MTTSASTETPALPRVLLTHHLRQLKLPTVLREYEKVAAEAARERSLWPCSRIRRTISLAHAVSRLRQSIMCRITQIA